MATSFIKKSMAYLGLVDDYDDYDEYDRPAPLSTRQRPVAAEPEDEAPAAAPGRIRVTPAGSSSGTVAAPAQQPAARPATSPSVKISTPDAGAKVHIVAPARFADAVEIANRLMANQPVIVNMQTADRDLQRRHLCPVGRHGAGGRRGLPSDAVEREGVRGRASAPGRPRPGLLLTPRPATGVRAVG